MPFKFPFSYPFYYNRYRPPRQYFTRSQRTDRNLASPSSNVNFSNSSNTNGHTSSKDFDSSNHTSSKEDYSSSIESSNHHSDDRSVTDDGECIFEIFGLKLFFDDILILCILFFLYTEEVKDYELFLCLILLLIT